MVVALVLDGHRVVQPVLEQCDPALEHALLVLRRVVLEVLGEVAELARALDRLDDLEALRPLELRELGLEGRPLVRRQVLGFGSLTREG